MNDARVKADVNTRSANANVPPDEKRGFEWLLFDLSKMTTAMVFPGIVEQNVVRLQEHCEKMKAAAGEMVDVLQEAYSTNAKGAADYGVKVIRISNVNATSAFDFFSNLMATKSPLEIMTLAAAHAYKNLDIVSTGNRELWDLTQKFAIAAAEPVKTSVIRVLQKIS